MFDKNISWKNIELVTENIRAFVYVITINKDGEDKWYIGYKTIRSGWKNYISSSKYVKADKQFITSKIILEVFENRADATGREEELITILDAVKSDKYYNRCNAGKEFNAIGLPKTEKQKASISRLHADPAFRSKRDKSSKSNMEKLRSDPEFKDRNKAAINKFHSDPKFKEKQRATLTRTRSDPVFQANHKSAASINLSNLQANPVFRANMAALRSSPEFIDKHRSAVQLARSKKVQNLQTQVVYNSSIEAEKLTGISQPTISNHCLGKVKKQKWKFVE